MRFFPEEKWCCFVDNNVLSGTLIDGLKVINADELRQSFSDVFVVVANRFHYGEIEHQLLDAGFSPQNIVSTGRLSDEMTAEQYFEHGIMNPQDDEAFVDCGAYDGTTSELFMKWSGNDKSTAYAFEPDPDMAKRCRERLSGYRNAHVEASGVWDKNATLKFSADGACSTVNDSENEDLSGDEVRVVSLDDALKGKKATIIKMDVEGSERNALIGAKNIIASQKPRLAISIYHKPEDIWELPRLILEINPNYIFYLRHYTLCEYDTVLYAVQGEEQHEIHGIDKYKRAE